MAVNKKITRRDFLNGFAITLAAGSAISPMEAIAQGLLDKGVLGQQLGPTYPPVLQGMRGSHKGSFEVAHALSWQGKTWQRPAKQTEDDYDLVVVGGGISGLSAAWFFRQQHGPDARILILDNHDDFGGHAKRNEFNVDGETLIGHGGTQNIEGVYSEVASNLLTSLGIDLKKFERFFDHELYKKYDLGEGIFFDKNHFRKDKLVDAPFIVHEHMLKHGGITPANSEETVAKMPLSKAAKEALLTLLDDSTDFMAGKSVEEKSALLMNMSYDDFLRRHCQMPDEVVAIMHNIWQGSYGLAGNHWSAIAGAYAGLPGTPGLGVMPAGPAYDIEPVIHHFPDGNASIARMLVRQLIPGVAAGHTMEDVVKAKFNYDALDKRRNKIRLRLNSTVVNVVNTQDDQQVEVTYVKNGVAHRVNAKHSILACYNHIVPYLCPEAADEQKKALDWPEKVPVVFINVALRNWKAFAKLGVKRIYSPESDFGTFWLDFPVSMGEHQFAQDPEQPIILHIPYVPSVPGDKLTPREQFKASRHKLYAMSFDDFESKIFDQLDRMLGAGGFQSQRDIAGITVNRWPHGYTYQYSDLVDAPQGIWGEDGPHVAGRKQIKRISIANCDSHAQAYTQSAIDAAHRAVQEQLSS
ncbi:hypothetical protein A9Q81_10595 [Gammaproteobacteria bacterium 42_54_T18]|nr:hypothetical protein A9Q81_10595 [Gammaproteobacteria bacterium 42_54_T18]